MPLQEMYSSKPGSPLTSLVDAISADATSMTLEDASVLPSAPNICVIGSDSNAEIVSYTSISGNVVSGMVRGLGGTTRSAWAANTSVARNITSYDHDTFIHNINELQTDIDTLSDEVDGKQDTLPAYDTTPTANSTNIVTSGGVKTALDTKAPLASPALTGTPTAPTATRGTNTTQIASTAFVQDALVTSFRDVYKVTLPSVSSSKRTFTASGITANHEMVVEGFAYFSNPSAVTGTLTITTAANSITVTGSLSGTTNIIVTLGIPRSLIAS